MYSNKLDLCEALMKKGYALLPVHYIKDNGHCSCSKGKDCGKQAGKHPACPNGFKDATKDIEQFKKLVPSHLSDFNIAVATGEVSGIWTLDDDDINANQAITAGLPKTVCFKTGSGNRQYVFLYDEASKDLKTCSKVNGLEIDVRTDGGYAILPPSNHVQGLYEWINSPDEMEPAEAPDWLITMLPKKDKPKAEKLDSAATQNRKPETFRISDPMEARVKAYLKECEPAIEGKKGQDKTYKIACYLIEEFGYLSDEFLFNCLTDWNATCVPPWPEDKLRKKLSEVRKKTEYKGQDNQHIEDDQGEEEESLAPEFPSLGDEAYQGLLGEIVRAIEPETEADPAGVMLSLLTAFGNSVGNNPYYQVGSSKHHANLFACIVGDTASGKGQAWSIARNMMYKADPDWERFGIARGLASGEGLIERVSDDLEGEGNTPSVLKRLLVVEEEFARPITAMRREGNTLSPILRSAWDTQSLEVMTRGKSRLFASNAYISILGQITPDELKKLLKDSVELVNGFGNRFLWGCVRHTKLLPHGGNHSVLNRFAEPLKNAIERAKCIQRMDRSEEANRLWEQVYPKLKISKKGIYGRTVDRACPQVVRLSMLYALADGSPTISRDHLKAALAVWDYCEASARWLFGGNDSTPSDPLEAKILDLLEDGPKTNREIRDRVSSKQRSQMPSALESLKASKLITFDGSHYAVVHGPNGPGGPGSEDDRGPDGPDGPLDQRTTPKTESIAPEAMDQMDHGPDDNTLSGNALADLIDWINANQIELQKLDNGYCWLSLPIKSTPPPWLKTAEKTFQPQLRAIYEARYKPKEEAFMVELGKALENPSVEVNGANVLDHFSPEDITEFLDG